MKLLDSPIRPHFTPSSWSVSGTLNVVAIYEDFAAGVRVREALELMNHSLAPMTIVGKAWSFDMLTRLDVRAAAVREAATADLLIVAGNCHESLPHQITRWLDRCRLEGFSRPSALVALHDEDPYNGAVPLPLTSELKTYAENWGVEFISDMEFDHWLSRDFVPYVIHRTDAQADTRPAGRMAPVYSQPQRERLAV